MNPPETKIMQGEAWCVLRTSGGKTLALADSLGKAGFDVWTPREVKQRRRPRSKVMSERELPIAPTFVFVRSDHLSDLLAIKALPVNPHPRFTIFTYAGRIPCIADAQVKGFRDAEERAQVASRRNKRRKLVMGERVRMTDGAYAGLSGVVELVRGEFAIVGFGGVLSMKVDSWLLSPDIVQDRPSPLGAAA